MNGTGSTPGAHIVRPDRRLPSRDGPTVATPVSPLAFLGVAVASFGGPLALGALYVPGILADVSGSAGLVTAAGALTFGVVLLVWLRYSRRVATAGGLYTFVLEAAGRRTALVQAGLWIASYGLYLVYTTASIVYELLPTVLPGSAAYQPLLEVAIPVVLAATMLAGRGATLAVLGALSTAQLLLLVALAVVTIGHDAPAGSFALPPPTGALGAAAGQVALLYVCGSLPLYLGGETRRPTRTVRRGLVTAYALTTVAVVAAVFPLAQNPAFTRAVIPGMSVARVFSGAPLAVSVGLGVAASVAGVMLVELLALSRLLHALTGYPLRRAVGLLSAVLVLSAPLTLINPTRTYDLLLKPSLVALWLSQLMVFVVYPRFARRRGRLRASDLALAVGASAVALYGLFESVRQGVT